jgi:hypothetical protein
MSAIALRFAALVLAALVVAGCQSAPEASGPNTVTSGATTITTGGIVRIDAGYVGG